MLKVFDLSSWEDNINDPRRIDFNSAKAGGVVAAIFRCANGTLIDKTYRQFVNDCTGVMPWGTYGILYPNLTAKSQANAYVSFLKETGHGDLPLIVDWELEGVTWQMVAEYIAILQRDIPNTEILIYSRAEYLKRMLPNKVFSPLKYLWFTQFHVWQAQYSIAPDPLPIGFTRVLWQYTDHYDASSVGIQEAQGVDMSYFDGDIEKFNDRFGVSVFQPPVNVPVTVTPGIWRIKDDIEAGRDVRHGLPSTVRLQGGKGSCLLPSRWMAYCYKIQGNPNYQFSNPYTLSDSVGWHNEGAPNKVEQVVFSGNIVEVLRVVGNKAYIKTVPITDAPPSVLVKPFPSKPHALIENFSIQYHDHFDLTTDGKYARTIVFCDPGESLWIDTKELKK